MKVCFFLQRQFAYIAHNLAVLLKEKYGVNDFCGYVYLRSSYHFLKSQADINYTALVLDEDIHKEYKNEKIDPRYLAYLEKEFGIPHLWPYITLDRIVMFNQPMREYPHSDSLYSHEDMIKIFQVKARAILAFLKREKPDAILFPNIGGISPLLAYHIAKKWNISVLHLFPTSIASIHHRCLLTERYDRFTGVEKILANPTSALSSESLSHARKILSDFRSNPKSYDSRIAAPAPKSSTIKRMCRLPVKISRHVIWLITLIGIYLKNKATQDYSSENPWHYFIDRAGRKIREMIGFDDLYDPLNPDEDFVFYPLHMDPETSTLLHAPFYTNQINLIAQIARSLPLHYKLYVKEHPFMVNYRPRAYYKEIKKIPNVKLINPMIPGVHVVAKSKLVTTIVSTAGWEGLLLKKPVISFGDWFYNFLSMVKRCREIEQLPYLIKEQLENFEYHEEELVRYLAAVFEDSADADLGHLWEQEIDNEKKKKGLEPLADLMAKKMNLF